MDKKLLNEAERMRALMGFKPGKTKVEKSRINENWDGPDNGLMAEGLRPLEKLLVIAENRIGEIDTVSGPAPKMNVPEGSRNILKLVSADFGEVVVMADFDGQPVEVRLENEDVSKSGSYDESDDVLFVGEGPDGQLYYVHGLFYPDENNREFEGLVDDFLSPFNPRNNHLHWPQKHWSVKENEGGSDVPQFADEELVEFRIGSSTVTKPWKIVRAVFSDPRTMGVAILADGRKVKFFSDDDPRQEQYPNGLFID